MNIFFPLQALPSVNQNGEIEGRRHNPVYDEDEDDRDKLLGNLSQCSHRLEKYLNLEGFLEKSLKTKSALKSTGKSLKTLEMSLILLFSVGLSTVDRDLNQYKNVVPLFGAA